MKELFCKKPPKIGMRKWKSILSVFIGFWVWQLVRLLVPDLEVHPIYIYIYGVIEIRDSSDKTRDMGKKRIKTTFIAFFVGFVFLYLQSFLKTLIQNEAAHVAVEVAVLLVGILTVLWVSDWMGCHPFCGLAAAMLIILLISHSSDDEPIFYALLRASQTIIAVFIAWFVNVKLFPFPGIAKKEIHSPQSSAK